MKRRGEYEREGLEPSAERAEDDNRGAQHHAPDPKDEEGIRAETAKPSRHASPMPRHRPSIGTVQKKLYSTLRGTGGGVEGAEVEAKGSEKESEGSGRNSLE